NINDKSNVGRNGKNCRLPALAGFVQHCIYFMANFGLTFTFIDTNNDYCKQIDSSSKIATKVYTARWA
ncbi:hypothetical protein Q4534_23930, partial [Cyclobacterium sp. 1_MG-2023]|uniref:hypothetical protein n=1 Tax=Cyclobacterium sp. 1_MG-2023 TaxID=3062681 RepID=UPI0026E426DA